MKVNCRRICSLLSAYIDAELTGYEMLEIRAHLDDCAPCRMEHESLRATKHLLGSLALKAPREELEALLLSQADRESRPAARWLPSWMLAALDGAVGIPVPRPRTLAAAALSVAGVFLASAPLREAPHEPAFPRTASVPANYPMYVDDRLVQPSTALPASDPTPLTWGHTAPVTTAASPPVSVMPASGGGIYTASSSGGGPAGLLMTAGYSMLGR